MLRLLMMCMFNLIHNRQLTSGPVNLQIGTAQQAAIGMTASYPGLLKRNALEEYAISQGEPSIPEIINQGYPYRHTLTWEHVKMYVQKLNIHNIFTYLPLQSMADPQPV